MYFCLSCLLFSLHGQKPSSGRKRLFSLKYTMRQISREGVQNFKPTGYIEVSWTYQSIYKITQCFGWMLRGSGSPVWNPCLGMFPRVCSMFILYYTRSNKVHEKINTALSSKISTSNVERKYYAAIVPSECTYVELQWILVTNLKEWVALTVPGRTTKPWKLLHLIK